MKRLARTRKLFGFLRETRHELFDDAFQAELESMYRQSGAGKDPKPPALLAMVMLLQAYHGISDAEAVELSVVDLRWQMVLDRLGTTEPPFSQGALSDFRARLIEHDMDQRLLERTVELAQKSKGFDWKKLPKTLRVALDSSPLEGAGRVEDTITCSRHQHARSHDHLPRRQDRALHDRLHRRVQPQKMRSLRFAPALHDLRQRLRLPSSTDLPTSPESRAVAPATSVYARTCSTCAAAPPSSTSKPSTASRPPVRPDFWVRQTVCRSSPRTIAAGLARGGGTSRLVV